MKKFVLKLELSDDREKRKAMKIVAALPGLDEISMDMKSKKLTVVGSVDPVSAVSRLRKYWPTEIILVGPAKEPEKKEEPKKENAKKDEPKKDDEPKKEDEKKDEPKKEEGKGEEQKKEEPKKEETKEEGKKDETKKEEEKKAEPAPAPMPVPMPMLMPAPPHVLGTVLPPYRPYYPPMNPQYHQMNMNTHYPPLNMNMNTHYPQMNSQYYVTPSVEENPNACVIC